MIQFSCHKCGKSFSVEDRFAGRSARCKACDASTIVPMPPAGPAPTSSKPSTTGEKIVIDFGATAPTNLSSVAAKLPPRTRRLLADAEQVRRAFSNFPPIHIRSIGGDPPDRYQIEYRIRGLARGNGNEPIIRDQHVVDIQLTREYPRQEPVCRILTPIFHPNFDPSMICTGHDWTASEKLRDLIIRIGEMIAYQSYGLKAPLDGEAAMWTDLNRQRFPIDNRDLHPPDLE